MRVIMLTAPTAKSYFDAMVIDSKGSLLDSETSTLIEGVIRNVSGMLFDDPSNHLTVYLTFIYMMLNLHSPIYVRASSPQSGMSTEHLDRMLAILKQMNGAITADNILVTDKMDILHGTSTMLSSEHSKFSVWFYEMVFDIANNTVNPDRVDDVFEETVRYIENVISNIEKNIIFIGQDLSPEDVVVMCIYPVNGSLLFIID